jgi:hypothetical protein
MQHHDVVAMDVTVCCTARRCSSRRQRKIDGESPPVFQMSALGACASSRCCDPALSRVYALDRRRSARTEAIPPVFGSTQETVCDERGQQRGAARRVEVPEPAGLPQRQNQSRQFKEG